MKNSFQVLLALILPLLAFSQSRNNSSNEQLGINYLNQNITHFNVQPEDVSEMIITDNYVSKHNGVNHIYYQQSIKGIPVYNAFFNVNINKEGQIVYSGNRLIPEIRKKVDAGTAALSPVDALARQLEHTGIKTDKLPAIEKSNKHYSFSFEETEFSEGNIIANLVYYPVEDKLILSYEMQLLQKDKPHFWNTVINASTGEVIAHKDATLYCSFAKNGFKNHDSECRHHSKSKPNKPNSFNLPATYRVYPLPAESPIHGTHELVTDPHVPQASPFGWHDIDGAEGAEFTITRGNNVHAYRDADDTGLSAGDEPDGGEDLIFDFVHNVEAEPDSSIQADITNLFYMNNMMHDITYLFGFDEESGNFQNNNYGQGGAQGDHVNAQGQDGANILDADHLNNANFATPADGQSGRMQMYYWSQTQSSTFITEPAEIAGGLEVVVPSATDWGFNYATEFSMIDITSKVVIVDDGTITNPTRGCNPLVNGDEVDGRIAMIDRGICEFGTKALNAQEAGAVAALICNIPGVNGGDGEEGVNMGGGVDGLLVNIPAIFLKHSDCELIRASIDAGVDVIINIKERSNEGPDHYSSSFDNGVIAHEYGHGISSRLTGGPSASGCLGNDEQMGEGWSDFFSLIMTVEPGDQGSDRRGIGNYVDGLDPDGRGIRRYPYSTDMNINPQTMKDIHSAGSIHGVGEVWADALWDMYWAFVDRYGYDPDWNNTESGNFKAVQLVIDGMKIQPCSPGFMDGRDAILAADRVNYNGDNQCLIWDVFARRGMGYFATQGSNETPGDNIEDFEALPTCIKELKIRKDITSVLIPGEETEIILAFANHTDSTENNVIISDELPENSTFMGHDSEYDAEIVDNMIVFDIGDMPSLTEDTIRYTIISDPDVHSEILYSDDVEDPDLQDENWDREIIEGNNFWQLNGLEDFAYSGFTSWYIAEIPEISKSDLIYKNLSVVGDNPVLRIWHMFNTTTSVNGGFIQISTDGVIWDDVTDLFIRNEYPTTINYSTFALPSLEGFTGNSNGFIDSYLSLAPYKGQDIMIRFKFGTDETTNFFAPDNAWFVDDIDLIDLIEYSTRACIESDLSNNCTPVKKSIIDADESTSSAEIITDLEMVRVFPNPAQDYVIIDLTSHQVFDANISLSAMDGREVLNRNSRIYEGDQRFTLDTRHLSPGFYVLSINNGHQVFSRKLIIH